MFRSLLLGGLALVLTAAISQADTSTSDKAGPDGWSQWRGPKRDAHSPDTGLLQKWDKGGPPRLWEAKGAGLGYSSLAVTGGRIYTLGDTPEDEDNREEFVSCFEESTGKRLWKTRVDKPWSWGNPDWHNGRSTPTVVGDRLYVITPHGLLVCLDTDGKEQWHKDLKKELGGDKADPWGYSESVLIDGDQLICTPGRGKATLVALNPKDGKLIWKAVVKGDRGAGHASVVIAEVGGTRIYVQTTGSGALGVRAKDGRVLWTYAFDPITAVIPTPIVRDDLVFLCAGYDKGGGALLRQVPSSDGGIDVKKIYPGRDKLEKRLSNKHGGVVLVGDHLYGDSQDSGNPWCAELMTGKVRWTRRGGPTDKKGDEEAAKERKKDRTRSAGNASASMAYADGHLYVHYADGTMVLVKASPEDYQAVSAFKVQPRTALPGWAHPVIAGKKLFVREGDYILCYDLQQK